MKDFLVKFKTDEDRNSFIDLVEANGLRWCCDSPNKPILKVGNPTILSRYSVSDYPCLLFREGDYNIGFYFHGKNTLFDILNYPEDRPEILKRLQTKEIEEFSSEEQTINDLKARMAKFK